MWQGSAIDCNTSNNEVSLLHNRFNTTFTKSCNNGTIVGLSLYVEGNNYTSQLTIIITTNMIGKTIECAHDSGTSEELVGSYTVNYSKDSVCANLSDVTSEPTLIMHMTGTRFKFVIDWLKHLSIL